MANGTLQLFLSEDSGYNGRKVQEVHTSVLHLNYDGDPDDTGLQLVDLKSGKRYKLARTAIEQKE